ncbi:BREX-2 system adenine-specific DNA-methyltransferase PglX [Micromonospora vinacea]|uniref:BREX-2 system adenine-specific DNA-methyltransferase PglX n=1 Tax=Micromonospora vinacea TaxID=709878 RepID=UPI003452DBA2
MVELKALQAQVKTLVDDLRGQVAETPGLRAELRQEYNRAKAAERVGASFETWLDDVLDQAAVAWVLGCVFVRFCEDNELIDWTEVGKRRTDVNGPWIGGADPAASAERAVQHRQAYLIANPRHNDRHWLREAFGYLAELKATGKIFDKHNPVWRFNISGPAAEELSEFFRRGPGQVSLRVDDLNTRFLGDLYERLSLHARKTYALLQTPEFVEEFILDRTFEPAVKEFGLPVTSVLDPTCGSGHFLLGAFHRLVCKWQDREPATDVKVLAERALGQVTGVDINPFAVAIARFRLLIAAMKVCGLTKLERTPGFPVRVATGDSLLHWGRTSRAQGDLVALLEDRPVFAYESEDADVLKDYLAENQYTVVVGNPPYITVADSVRSGLYRRFYDTCSGKYALTVPFAQRFFALAVRGDHDGDGAGRVGQITGNAFMKREFGKKLINEFFAGKVELTEVVDTSGAFIPGHGTPTVILVGQNRLVSSRYSAPIRTLLSVRGEQGEPDNPAQAAVWSAIVAQIDRPGSESDWISAVDLARNHLTTHPWSLAGGGATDLMEKFKPVAAAKRMKDLADSFGITSFTLEDDLYVQPAALFRRVGIENEVRPMALGDGIRDWNLDTPESVLFPYDQDFQPVDVEDGVLRYMWPARTSLSNSRMFGNQTKVDAGLRWTEYGRLTSSKLRVPMSIGFAFVATHNHFVLDRGGKVFNRSAPVIKLPEGATEDDHLRLLGVLNSSTACFWLKQVSHNKGSQGVNEGFKSQEWERFFEFTGTKLQDFPLPAACPLGRARELDRMAQRLSSLTPAAVAASGAPTRRRLAEAEVEYNSVRARMIALQEELDWEVYRLYGLIDEDLTCDNPPELALGERAFEIVLHTSGAQTEWFNRHGSKPIDRPQPHWPAEYRSLVERRIAAIGSNRHIGLIERPECKRRWSTEGWEKMQSAALRDWLLDRLEAPELWGGPPASLSVAQLADRVGHDRDFRAVLDLWVGHDNYDLTKTLGLLIANEHVPYLPAQRYKPSGLRKRAQWERTWALQRREDAGEKVEIEVPPKYTSADFTRPSYWRARGKLDVPKERFISYPQAGRDSDGSELLGWAGWDHLKQAQALATVYLDRKTQEAWPAHRLLPLLAGLVEIEPWLHQWHSGEQLEFPGSPAEFFTDFINAELSQLSSDRSALALMRGVPELP